MRSVSAAHRPDLIRRKRLCLIPVLVWMASVASFLSANAQGGAASSDAFASPIVIVIGFVGGFVRPDDDRHLEVQMIERLAK